MTVICQHDLPNRIKLIIEDQSNRYFGDYHRVKLLSRCPICVAAEYFSASPDPHAAAQAAQRILGQEVLYEKSLERMGVPSHELERTKQELLDQFLQINQSYLARDDFPARFIAMKLREKQQTNLSGGRPY